MHDVDAENTNNSDQPLTNERNREPFDNEYNQVVAEVVQITNEVNSIEFEQIVEISQTNQSNVEEIDYDFDQHYDLSRGTPMTNLEIRLGSSILPRYSCACHKLDLAIRHALEKHLTVCNIIRRLSNSNSHIRRCINLNRNFRINKARLRIENVTRWSSAYLMLESVLRAYSKNLFDPENPELRCPVIRKDIEVYSQILKPAYILNINFQNNHSSIADTTIGKVLNRYNFSLYFTSEFI